LMPTSWRASFTSSSLNGLMTASIFFMTLPRLCSAEALASRMPTKKEPAGEGPPARSSRL
jgi:hypothetical protein